jgi:protein-S-isoprenylcysteine O-methyltransferase Ste14
VTTTLWLPLVFFAQSIVIFYPGVFVFWFIVHLNIVRLRRLGTRGYWVAPVAWMITSGPLLFFRRAMFSVRWLLPQPIAGILGGLGIVALALAIFILARARRQIPFRTMVGLPEIKPSIHRQPLLNSGIYSKTRNPIYLAHLLVVFSAAAMTNFPASWILFGMDCAVLPLLIRAEERELLTRYGKGFAEYMRGVPRLFPRLR